MYQGKSALLLLMLGILADNHDLALATNDLALFADRLDGRTNLHGCYLLLSCTSVERLGGRGRQLLAPVSSCYAR